MSGQNTEKDVAVDFVEYEKRWEDQYWAKGLKEGEAFDASKPSPAFVHWLEKKRVEVAGKRVLVPGCGRGYDLIALLQAGAAEAVGLELAPSAVTAASEYLASQGVDPGRAHVQLGNFFTWQDEKGQFDVGYDYTFLCALHPDMRGDWAAGWARQIKQGGILKTLIFPVDPERQTGPPWHVTPQIYEALLTQHGFECVVLEKVPTELSHPGREGKEYMAIWEKK